nr:MAG TPA: Flavivirus DEAD domain [Caudoviricetes sp.]
MTIIDEIHLFQSILDSDERIRIIIAKRSQKIKMHMI